MTKSVVNPRLSSAHRRACLSLYHAILKKVNRLVLPDESTTSIPVLSSLISDHFRRDRLLTSRNAIVSALSRGRAVHALLSSASSTPPSSGTVSAIKQLETLASVAIAQFNTSTTPVPNLSATSPSSSTGPSSQPISASPPPLIHKRTSRKTTIESQRSQFWADRIPNPIQILARPVVQKDLPDPSRPRKVPSFVVAQGIPFLRYKSGPQSPVLSRIIRQCNQRDQKRWDRLARWTDEIDFAEAEDKWDQIVKGLQREKDQQRQRQQQENDGKRGHVRGRGAEIGWSFGMSKDRNTAVVDEGSWAMELKGQVKTLQRTISGVSAKRRDMGEKLWNIVVQEKKLAEKEKVERRELRRKQREEQQRADANNAGAGIQTRGSI